MGLYREYRLKFYLNGHHYMTYNGVKGEVHPHTWEMALNIRVVKGYFLPFNRLERGLSEVIAPYQDGVMNDIPPFTSILPTVENMAEYFATEFSRIIDQFNGTLTRMETNETPTRSYILVLDDRSGKTGNDKQAFAQLVDSFLDDIMQ